VERPTRWLAGFAAATANPGQEVFILAVGRSYGDQRLTTDIAVTDTTGTQIRT